MDAYTLMKKLEHSVSTLHTSTDKVSAEDVKRANIWLLEFEKQEVATTVATKILTEYEQVSENVIFYAAHLLLNKVRNLSYWKQMPEENKLSLLNLVYSICSVYAETCQDELGIGMSRVLLLLIATVIRLSVSEESNFQIESITEKFMRPPYIFMLHFLERIPAEVRTSLSDYNIFERRNLFQVMEKLKITVLQILSQLAQACIQSESRSVFIKEQIAGAACLNAWVACDILNSDEVKSKANVGINLETLCLPQNQHIIQWVCNHLIESPKNYAETRCQHANLSGKQSVNRRLFSTMSSIFYHVLINSSSYTILLEEDDGIGSNKISDLYCTIMRKISYSICRLHSLGIEQLRTKVAYPVNTNFYGEDEGYGESSVETVRASRVLASYIGIYHLSALLETRTHNTENERLEIMVIKIILESLENPIDYSSMECSLEFMDVITEMISPSAMQLNRLNFTENLDLFRSTVISLTKALQRVIAYAESIDAEEKARCKNLQTHISDTMIVISTAWPNPFPIQQNHRVEFDFRYLSLVLLFSLLGDVQTRRDWTYASAILTLMSGVVEASDMCLGDDDDDDEIPNEQVIQSWKRQREKANFEFESAITKLSIESTESCSFPIETLQASVLIEDGICLEFPSMWSNVINSIFNAVTANTHWGVRRTSCKVVGEICESLLNLKVKDIPETLILVNKSISFLLCSLQVSSGGTCGVSVNALKLISVLVCRKRNRAIASAINDMTFRVKRIRADGDIINQEEEIHLKGVDGIIQVALSDVVSLAIENFPKAKIDLYEALSRIITFCPIISFAKADEGERGIVCNMFNDNLCRLLSPVLTSLNCTNNEMYKVPLALNVIARILFGTEEILAKLPWIKQTYITILQTTLNVVVAACSPLLAPEQNSCSNFLDGEMWSLVAESLCRLFIRVVENLGRKSSCFCHEIVKLTVNMYVSHPLSVSLDCITACIYSESMESEHDRNLISSTIQRFIPIHFTVNQVFCVSTLPLMQEPDIVKSYFSMMRDIAVMDCGLLMQSYSGAPALDMTILEVVLAGAAELLCFISSSRDATRSICSFLRFIYKCDENKFLGDRFVQVLKVYQTLLLYSIFGSLIESKSSPSFVNDLLFEILRQNESSKSLECVLLGSSLCSPNELQSKLFVTRIAIKCKRSIASLDSYVCVALCEHLLANRKRKSKFKAEINEFKLFLNGHTDYSHRTSSSMTDVNDESAFVNIC